MQQQREDILIERLKAIIRTSRHATGEPTWRPQRSWSPVTEEELVQAETQLGFVLPALLRRIYREVGNGGFGPGYGLLLLNELPPNGGHDTTSLVAEYQGMKAFSQQDIDEYFAEEEEKPALWPERVLILCDWGCNIYSCLDCSSSELPIFRMDSNENFLVEWAIEAPSLHQWLERWIDGTLARLDWDQATKVSVSQLGKAF
jgi:hypothetical protein